MFSRLQTLRNHSFPPTSDCPERPPHLPVTHPLATLPDLSHPSMNSSIPRPVQQPGERNSATLPGVGMDLLLAATACCSLFSFLAGSILHADLGQLPASLPVLFTVSALFLIFAALVRLSGHPGWGFAGLFGLLHLVARHPSPLLTAATTTAALLCLAYLLRKFRLSPKAWSHAAIMGLLGTLAFFSVNHVCYTCFDLHNRLTDGSIHIDPLYHSAVASMIKTYGITSTGVNGLPPLNYHVLSHEAIAAISRLSDAPVFSCYGIVPFILFSPLLLFGIASAAMMLAPADFRNRPRPLWLATCLSLILLPLIGSPEPTAGHFVRSESFLVSLGLLCAGLIPLSRNEIKPATILLAALLTLLMSHAKLSVGIVYAGLWALRLCFARSASPLREVTATLLVSAAASPFLFSSGSSHPMEFAPPPFLSQLLRPQGNLPGRRFLPVPRETIFPWHTDRRRSRARHVLPEPLPARMGRRCGGGPTEPATDPQPPPRPLFPRSHRSRTRRPRDPQSRRRQRHLLLRTRCVRGTPLRPSRIHAVASAGNRQPAAGFPEQNAGMGNHRHLHSDRPVLARWPPPGHSPHRHRRLPRTHGNHPDHQSRQHHLQGQSRHHHRQPHHRPQSKPLRPPGPLGTRMDQPAQARGYSRISELRLPGLPLSRIDRNTRTASRHPSRPADRRSLSGCADEPATS